MVHFGFGFLLIFLRGGGLSLGLVFRLAVFSLIFDLLLKFFLLLLQEAKFGLDGSDGGRRDDGAVDGGMF